MRAPSLPLGAADLAPIDLLEGGALPAYRQIYERLRQRIAEGALRGGERLPSARALAGALGVARGTVDAAYAMLAGEGYIVGRGAAGTVVAPGLATAAPLPAAEPAPEWHAYDEARMPRGPDGAPLPFQLGLPALDAFPRTLWTRLAAREARRLAPADMAYPDPRGEPRLRAAIAQYLAIARGIAANPDQILVTSGFQGALGLVRSCLAIADAEVWIEDPGYFLARRALETAGARLVPVPVDDDGLDVGAGIARAPRARLALVTPSHHAPLGVALALPRRLALLAWAADAEAYILEDDYDGEFRYRGHPLPALKSLDRADRVLYAGTFSKVLLPSLR